MPRLQPEVIKLKFLRNTVSLTVIVQPVAVPSCAKSLAVTPSTTSLNETAKVGLTYVEAAAAAQVGEGAVRSIVIAAIVGEIAGPKLPTASLTLFAFNVN